MYQCRACGEKNKDEETEIVELVNVRTDLNSKFKYFKCNICGSIQIATIPDNLGDYYDNTSYYSFGSKNIDRSIKAGIKKKIKQIVLGSKPYMKVKNSWLASTIEKIHLIEEIDDNDKKQRILDVGCGSGDFLNKLRGIGYRNLVGVDPFLESDFETDNGVVIKPLSIDEVEGCWDQIWMVHSFEHVTDPLETLIAVKKRLAPDGLFIMELPIIDSYEYERYGKFWTGCDAPVHIVMYTIKALESLFEKAGMQLVNRYNLASESFLILSEMAEKGYSLDKASNERIHAVLGEKKLTELCNTMKRINEEKRSGLVTLVIKTV